MGIKLKFYNSNRIISKFIRMLEYINRFIFYI